MLIQEVIEQFLYSRKHGISSNSKGVASDKTIEAYRYALSHFSHYMEETLNKQNYEQIHAADVRSFVEWATKETWSLSRYILVFKTMKVMFKWMDKDEDCQEMGLKSWHSKMPKLPATPRRDSISTPKDLRQWQKAFETNTILGMRNWMIFCLFIETGMRRSELAGLKIENLQMDNRTLYVPDGKTGSRTIPLSERVCRDLKLYLRRRRESKASSSVYLFPSCRSDHGPSPEMISKVFRRMRRAMSLPYLTPHSLRHAFSTYYLKNGGNVEMLRNITGHKTYTAMGHYLHLSQVGGKEQKVELDKVSPLKMLDRIR